MIAVFEQKFEETFKTLAERGRTPRLWVQYHYMVDVLKIFIKTERLADHEGHLSCIVIRMLDIFSAAGHHQYAKGARLYCQLIKQLETLPGYKDTFESFTAHGNHVVRYSCHDWSGTWCDICIEQRLMKAAKSEGGLSRGRMKNSDSGHKCWVQTLNHFSDVNQRMEESVKKHGPLHKDLAKTRMKRDAETIGLALKWFEENNHFDHDRDKQLLVSFSTGFTSTADDAVNAERAVEVEREMQIKLDGQSVTSTMEVKFMVQTLTEYDSRNTWNTWTHVLVSHGEHMDTDTWNVGSMTGRSGEVVETLARRRVDICCVQETRWKGGSARMVTGKSCKYKILWQSDWLDKVMDWLGLLCLFPRSSWIKWSR